MDKNELRKSTTRLPVQEGKLSPIVLGAFLQIDLSVDFFKGTPI